ncbi:unnamed protein product [marine sediment metagenome]|uniref:Uncharacterized protein n=1 Tax=marine sediment metagenome TaxID=412755 RepID=X1F8G3_9ZZZZ
MPTPFVVRIAAESGKSIGFPICPLGPPRKGKALHRWCWRTTFIRTRQVRLTFTSFGPGNCEKAIDHEFEKLFERASEWLTFNAHGLGDAVLPLLSLLAFCTFGFGLTSFSERLSFEDWGSLNGVGLDKIRLRRPGRTPAASIARAPFVLSTNGARLMRAYYVMPFLA